MATTDKEVVIITRRALYRLSIEGEIRYSSTKPLTPTDFSSLGKVQTVILWNEKEMPTKLSTHIDPTLDGEYLLIAHQKTYWLLDTQTGTNLLWLKI